MGHVATSETDLLHPYEIKLEKNGSDSMTLIDTAGFNENKSVELNVA
jgi:hypothetical protein